MAFFHLIPERKADKAGPSTTLLGKLSCANCTLDKVKLFHPKMKPTGAEKPLIYMLGEAPDTEDDEVGVQFSGSGQIVRDRIPSKWSKHIRWNNVVRCKPKRFQATPLEIACCRKLQADDIIRTKPAAVLTFGDALDWFIEQKRVADVWRGRKIAQTLGGHSFWLYPMLSPTFVRKQDSGDWAKAFALDLKRVFADAEAGFDEPTIIHPEEWLNDIRIWKPGDTVQKWARIIEEFVQDGENYGFDFETPTKLPYGNGVYPVTAALSDGEKTIGFPLAHPEARLAPKDQKLLMSTAVKALKRAGRVVAHSAPFEQEWLAVHHGPEAVHEIKWACTLAQAFTLDEREGAKGLGDLTTIYFGTNIKKMFPAAIARDPVGHPLDQVLPYNGTDAKGCLLVWYAQNAEVDKEGLELVSAANQRRSGSMALLMAQGVVPHIENARKLDVKFSTEATQLLDKILKLPEVQEYKKIAGKFNPNQPEDVKGVLNRVLDLGVTDTQEDTLKDIKHPFVKLILELRGVNRMKSTYIEPIINGTFIQPDGRIHARFAHTKARTSRTNSEDPNLQNQPKRKHKEVRSVIGAPKGMRIAAFDYGQIQARNIAMESKDKRLVDAFWTNYDIHGEWTERIAKAAPKWGKGIGDKDTFKEKRNAVKNEWTFPLFFGAQLNALSMYLGIPEHILAPLYNEFWSEFSGVKKWQQDLINFYNKHFYVKSLLGSRRRGPIDPNQLINAPIQRDEVDIVLDAQERIQWLAYERQEPWLYPVMEIHDDLTFYLPEEDSKFEDAAELIGQTLCKPNYDFINVPLLVECSVSLSDWDKLEEIHKFWSHEYGHKRREQ